MKEKENYIVLAIEHAKGGTLTDLMKKREQDGVPLSEIDCALIMKGILEGLRHIHQNDYVHRDLKPSNIVIDNVNKLETMKVVDFGLAVKVSNAGLDENCGTVVYQAPETMFGDISYGKAVDIWAAGFIMYELICNMHPLYIKGENKQAYKEKLRELKKLDFSKG